MLHEGPVPSFDPETWRLEVWGRVEQELSLSWADLGELPRIEVQRDFHCVTTWSRFDNRWGGVPVAALLERARPTPAATHVVLHAYDAIAYTTNLALSDFARDDNLLATHHDGEPLTPEHGGPIRAVVHHLYAWKSCKWLAGLELVEVDRRGFWETRGYHTHGDPWTEERYSHQEGKTARQRFRKLWKATRGDD